MYVINLVVLTLEEFKTFSLHSKKGELTGLIQISEDSKIKFVKESAAKSLELLGEVALDFGMECLFATDRDDLLERNLQKQKKAEDRASTKQEVSKAVSRAE